MLTTSIGMSIRATCRAVWSWSDMPITSAPTTTQKGRPRASMAMTMAMKPAPFVMKGSKVPAPTIER